MTTPDIQYFASSGTWVKPAGAVRVDIVLKGGDGGTATGTACGEGGGHSMVWPGNRDASAPYVSVVCNPRPSTAPAGSPGSLSVDSFAAADLPDTVEVTVGKGGRPGGRDGYALIITHLAEDEESGLPLLVQRPRNRATEAARDAAECIGLGRIEDARSLLAEASRELDTAERRAGEAAAR